MSRFMKPAGPRNIREMWHALWEAFKRVDSAMGNEEETPPTDPPDPPTVPSPGPGSHSHYIENLVNVSDSPVGVTRQVLAFDGRIARLEGAEPQPTAVLIAFESLDAAKAWYDMPAYQEAMKLRHASTDTTLLIAEGL